VVCDGKVIRIYFDGAQVGLKQQGEMLPHNNGASVRIGRYAADKMHYKGHIDEIRLSSVAREVKPVSIPAASAVLLDSDFEKDAAGWTPLDGTWEVKDGAYCEFSDKWNEQEGFWSVGGKEYWRNYKVETEFTSADNLGRSLLGFYWKDINNHYELAHEGLQNGLVIFRLSKVADGVRTVLASTSRGENADVPEINPKQPVARIAIEVRGDAITAAINDVKILEAFDGTFTGGAVAVGGLNRKILVNSVKVSKLAPAAAEREQAEIKLARVTVAEEDYRHAFLRGEKIGLAIETRNVCADALPSGKLVLSLASGLNESISFDLAALQPAKQAVQNVEFDTSDWKCGDYILRVEYLLQAGKIASCEYPIYVCHKPNPDRIRYAEFDGELNDGVFRLDTEHGLNGRFLTIDIRSDLDDIKRCTARYFDLALPLGINLNIHIPTNSSAGIPYKRDDIKVVLPSGKLHREPDP